MKIHQFPYSQDNFAYLLVSGTAALAIDPGSVGAVDAMIKHAKRHSLTIEYAANTHSHHDHTGGNSAILSRTNAKFINCKDITSDQTLDLGNESIQLFPTPGHTMDCICFAADDFIITGDTLFNGTIGNCFSGNLNAFFDSIDRIMQFPAQTRIFGGHDYVQQAMEAAKYIEPANPDIDTYLAAYDPRFVVSTLEEEYRVNPYLRFNAPEMIDILEQNNLPRESDFLRFTSTMKHF